MDSITRARFLLSDPSFNAWWEQCWEYIQQNPSDLEVLDCPDYGPDLEALHAAYLRGENPIESVRDLVDNWEPSDAEMVASFGTQWHDGCR
jgi:hypothetical protein